MAVCFTRVPSEPLMVRGSRARAAPVLCLALGRGLGESDGAVVQALYSLGRLLRALGWELHAGMENSLDAKQESCLFSWCSCYLRCCSPGLDFSLPRMHGSDLDTHKTHDCCDVDPRSVKRAMPSLMPFSPASLTDVTWAGKTTGQVDMEGGVAVTIPESGAGESSLSPLTDFLEGAQT